MTFSARHIALGAVIAAGVATAIAGGAAAGPRGDGQGRILYSTASLNVWRVFVVSPDGSGKRMVSAPREQAGDPDWSPDGRRIVFTSEQGSDKVPPGINVVDANGRHGRQIVSGWARREAAWSPGGRTIAYVARVTMSQDDIHVVGTDGTGDRNLTRSRGDDHQPAWSPDGRRIAFVRWLGKGKPSDVFVMRTDGTRARRLTHGLNPSALSWSKSGWLVFIGGGERGNPQVGDVYVMRTDGSGLRNVTRSRGWYARPTLSPDGRTILFALGDRKPPATPHVYTIRRDGSDLRALTTSTADEWQTDPAWSPSGAHIVYVGGQSSGTPQIWVVNADGSSPHPITPARWATAPLWTAVS